jgi:hypothetical protein
MFNFQAVQPAPHIQTPLPAPHTQATLSAPPHVTSNPPGPTPARTEETRTNQSTRLEEKRAARSTRRSERAHNPVRGQRGKRREGGGGGGRTRGASNYRDREVEVLLDIAEDLLPVGGKGWAAVGIRFREWAAATSSTARADRSLEMKFKQVSH